MQLPNGGRVGVGSSTLQHDTAQWQHDRQRTGGGSGDVGSTTAWHDMQPPDGNTTGSTQAAAAAAMQAAPQHGTTRNHPMVTQQAVHRQRWQGGQHHSAARHATT